ncbi:MAG: DMT family transporter [Pseudomonadota bacterium]
MAFTLTLVLLIALAIFAGAITPMQAVVNSKLGSYLTHPLWASLISFGGGVLSILTLIIVLRVGPPPVDGLMRAPWWLWTGGIFGVIIVTTSLVLAPKLGMGVLFASLVAGQMTGALLMDHFAVLGLPERNISTGRIFGTLLVLAGVIVMQLSTGNGNTAPGAKAGKTIEAVDD